MILKNSQNESYLCVMYRWFGVSKIQYTSDTFIVKFSLNFGLYFVYFCFVGEFDLHSLCSSSLSAQSTPNCNLLWNGHGYWANKITWVPLCPSSSEWHYPARRVAQTRRSVLWIFGDSVSSQFYHQVKSHSLCKLNFARCMYSYNWLYSLENYNATLKRWVYQKKSTPTRNLIDVFKFVYWIETLLVFSIVKNTQMMKTSSKYLYLNKSHGF